VVSPPAARPLVHARTAVAGLFVINAAAYANVVPRLPAIKADLALSNTALGTAVAALPVGALISGLASGGLIARFGSRTVAVACGTGFGVVLPLVGLAPSWGVLAATFFAFGLLDSLMDVSMNAHGLRVQRGYGRSIVSAMHGLWSLGAVGGGVAGTLAAGAGVGLPSHLLTAGAILIAASLATWRWLLPGPDDLERAQPATPGGLDRAGRRAARRRLAVLGLLVVMAAVIEDAPASWGAVLLRTELGTSDAAAGLVFIAFQSAMTLSRLTGDRLVDRYGAVPLVRGGALLAAGGVGLGLAVGEPVSVVVGFGLAALGTGTLFPLVFHAAGNLPGVSTGHGVAIVAWMSRLGFLVVPPLVGLVGDAVDLRTGLLVVPAAALVVAVLAPTLRDEHL
jgi:MFS family permease